MKKIILCLSLILAIGAQSIESTAYSWGDLQSWLPRIKAAKEFVTKQYDKKEYLPAETREAAMYVIGFVEGMRDGIILHEMVKLKKQYGDNYSNNVSRKINDGICLNETYSQIILRLDEFISDKNHKPKHDFMSLYLDFVTQQYPCQ